MHNVEIQMFPFPCAICGQVNWIFPPNQEAFMGYRCMSCKHLLHIVEPTWFQKLSGKYLRYFHE